MALQDSIIKLTGNIGDITFFKGKNGYGARTKGGVDANRIKTDPAFARTRENGAEFGKAGNASKVLRTALRTYLETTKDSRMSNRLTREMMKIIRSDATNARGERTVIAGDLTFLKGFEFNEGAKLGSSLFVPFVPTIDRASGNVAVAFPAFIPANMVARPEGATHLKLVMIAAEIDFAAGSYQVASAESNLVPVGPAEEPANTLTAALPAASTHPLFLVLGIQFTQLVNGAQYPLRNGAFNALTIVEVSRV
jgi:hypothetical protein